MLEDLSNASQRVGLKMNMDKTKRSPMPMLHPLQLMLGTLHSKLVTTMSTWDRQSNWGYYNDPKATKATITEDGWLRTGDLLSRDENHFYYYVDRLKIMLKYKGYKVSPLEIETVIRKLQGVEDVAVVGIPDELTGDLLVACVVRTPGTNVTAQEVKDIVKETLSDSKQLRGGVVFLDMLPMGLTTKCDRLKLKSMVALMDRE